jgi:hypothetical protein
MLREKFKWRSQKNESTDAEHSGGPPCKSDEFPVMGMEQRGRVIPLELKNNVLSFVFRNTIKCLKYRLSEVRVIDILIRLHKRNPVGKLSSKGFK